MKIAQLVCLMIGVAYTLTAAVIILVNMITSENSRNGLSMLAPQSGQTQVIVYWVFGLLLFAVAVMTDRFHKPIATSVGIPGILLMIFGGLGASVVFESQFGAFILNLLTAGLCIGGIYFVTRDDRIQNFSPVYGSNPKPPGNVQPQQNYQQPVYQQPVQPVQAQNVPTIQTQPVIHTPQNPNPQIRPPQ